MKNTCKTQYTPAPWEDNGNGLIYGQCSGEDDEAPFVADVCSNPDAYTELEKANARLIVAAPEMLAALKFGEALGEVEQADFWLAFETFLELARAAIHKAEIRQ